MRFRVLLTVSYTLGCTGTVSTTTPDATVEVSVVDIEAGRMDRTGPTDDTESRDVVGDGGLRDVGDVRDVSVVLDGGRCPPTLPDGGAPPPPPGVSRSCGPGGAPAWHCNEVAYCGGEFTMGSTDAAQVNGSNLYRTYRMRECDPRRRIVRGGYIDAYEVTVARYRAWVRAGMPHPASLEYVYPDGKWELDPALFRPQGYVNSGDGDTVTGRPATLQNCTWNPSDRVNDDLPINCVDRYHAIAFCWWDGRHVVSEEAWEYLASNLGSTTTIRPGSLTQASSCGLGDLNSRNGVCPQRELPREVNAFPLSGPPAVPGLFGMIGGVAELAGGPPNPLDGNFCMVNSTATDRCCDSRYPITDDHSPREGGSLRGSSWWLSVEDQGWMSHVSSRFAGGRTPATDTIRPLRSPHFGIRCARWVPGVW